MKNNIALSLLCITLLSGCHSKSEFEYEQERRIQLEQERKVAEEARKAAEEARKKAEDSKSTWQTIAWIVGVSAIGLLVFGVALGSSAKKEAEEKTSENNE